MKNILGWTVVICLAFIATSVYVVTPEIGTAQDTTIERVTIPKPAVDNVIVVSDRNFRCMALNIYFEARNQKNEAAMAAVGYTVINRVNHSRYPNDICEVVFQGKTDKNGNPIKHKCQFSWTCDGKADEPVLSNIIERNAWERSKHVAMKVITGAIANPIGNATMYHATYVSPYWKKSYRKVAQVESHIFYTKNNG